MDNICRHPTKIHILKFPSSPQENRWKRITAWLGMDFSVVTFMKEIVYEGIPELRKSLAGNVICFIMAV